MFRSAAEAGKVGAVALATTAVTAALVTTATPASAATRTVRLTLDGVTSSVTTSADTVSELLTDESVPYDATDLISPTLSARVVGGMSVSWTPARRVIVQRGDDVQTYRVTSKTVRGVRSELGLPSPKSGKSARFENRRWQISPFFSADGDRLRSNDIVGEDARAVVHNKRVAFRSSYRHIDRRVVKDRSPLVRQGSTRVYKQGRDGRRYVTFRTVFIDGRQHARSVAASRVVRDAHRKVVRIGTGPNWRALARCESGGNPNAVNPAGYYGLYQFSLSTWHAVGGKGNPTDYGYWEQTKRAWILFKGSGRSPWPVCGRHL